MFMKIEALNKTDNRGLQNDIISKIRDHINYKNLEPGDKLPSERMLSEKFEVSALKMNKKHENNVSLIKWFCTTAWTYNTIQHKRHVRMPYQEN